MSLDKDLEEALLNAKTGGGPGDLIEMLESIFKQAHAGQIAWILYGATWAGQRLISAEGQNPWLDIKNTFESVLEEMHGTEEGAIIRKHVDKGIARLIVALAIRQKKAVRVPSLRLLTTKDPREICYGCPERLVCGAEKLSTPDNCLTPWDQGPRYGSPDTVRHAGHYATLDVTPLRVSGDEVQVHSERFGRDYTLRIDDIYLQEPTWPNR